MSENLFKDLEDIARTYESFEGPVADVPGCLFIPTPFDILLNEVKQLKLYDHMGMIKGDKKVLLAGAGDARRGSYINRLGYDVYAIELNPDLINKSNEITDKLSEKELISKDRLKLMCGDCLIDKTYAENGLNFSDFSNIFIYLLPDTTQKLLDKIQKESNSGTYIFLPNHVEILNPERRDMEKVKRIPFEMSSLPSYPLNVYIKN